MPHLDHLLRALMISIPVGIIFGLFAGFLRKRLGQALAEKHASTWEILKRTIYAIGIFMFGVLAFYCIHIIKQPSFGMVYLAMSVLNGICLIRSFVKNRFDANGVPMKHHRDPKKVLPNLPEDVRVASAVGE